MGTDMNAWVLRIAPGRVDRVPSALEDNDLIIGWSEAKGLLDSSLGWHAFREIIHQTYYRSRTDYVASGSSAGSMWRFIRRMEVGDLVVVPHGPEFHVARVHGPARWDEPLVADDSAYRRRVEWLNNGVPIPRRFARAALISRMKIRQTCADATDLLEEITDALAAANHGHVPSFASDLRLRLIAETLQEIRSGRLDSFAFENLVGSVLRSLGAATVTVVPRAQDKGVDILATFSMASTFDLVLAVQAKHFQPDPPVGAPVIDQLVTGMEAEGATMGWVVTSGVFSEDAQRRLSEVEVERSLRIELVDGEQLAAMVVEGGLRSAGLLPSTG
jgi:predicted Mrr-cat superfamily restriction endonuclease